MNSNLEAYKNYRDSSVESIGIDITNRCNLNCPHCYSRKLKKVDLSLKQVKKILDFFLISKKLILGQVKLFCVQVPEK